MRYFRQPCAATSGPLFSSCRTVARRLCGFLILVAAIHVTASAEEIVVYTAEPNGPDEQLVLQDRIAGADADGAIQLEVNGEGGNAFAVWCLQAQIDYAAQFRPTLDCELAFVRQICGDLTVEERRKIKIAAEISLHDVAKRYKKWQNEPHAEHQVAVEPVILIREAIAAAVRNTVDPQLGERFAAETGKRAARRKRAAIMGFIACADRLLCLSTEQRQDLMASLSAGWQSSWEGWNRLTDANSAWVPLVPDEHLKCLREEQMAVWKITPKTEFGMANIAPFDMSHDDDWWGPGLREFVPLTLGLVEGLWQTRNSTPPAKPVRPMAAGVLAAPVLDDPFADAAP